MMNWRTVSVLLKNIEIVLEIKHLGQITNPFFEIVNITNNNIKIQKIFYDCCFKKLEIISIVLRSTQQTNSLSPLLIKQVM